MAGLYHEVIWIVPDWIVKTTTKMRAESGVVSSIELGYYRSDELPPSQANSEEDDREVIGFCDCSRENDRLRCFRVSEEGGPWNESDDTEEEKSGREIDPFHCTGRIRLNATLVTVSDAIKMLAATDLGNFKSDILLDIDEDYFGVELPWQKLTDAGIGSFELRYVDAAVRNLICARTGADETQASFDMRAFVEMYLRYCRFSRGAAQSTCASDARDLAATLVDNFVLKSRQEKPDLYCAGNIDQLLVDVLQVVRALNELTREQVVAILHIGFCFSESPKSFGFLSDVEEGFIVCHGANDPPESYTPTFTPSPEQFEADTRQLGELLDLLPPPKVVTIARSVRDGFTPRSLAPTIEEFLIARLTSQDARLRDSRRRFKVAFDSDLFNTSALVF